MSVQDTAETLTDLETRTRRSEDMEDVEDMVTASNVILAGVLGGLE